MFPTRHYSLARHSPPGSCSRVVDDLVGLFFCRLSLAIGRLNNDIIKTDVDAWTHNEVAQHVSRSHD